MRARRSSLTIFVVLGAAALILASGCRKRSRHPPEVAPAPGEVAPTVVAPTTGRTLTFTNQCPFDVWVQSVGSNAANIPCSPSTTSAQANCPTGFVCLDVNANTQYCVPGTTTATTFPLTSPSQITLAPGACPSGQAITDTASAQWGQCTCTGDAGCPANQVCAPIDSATQQCFWGFSLPNDGHLTAATGGGNTGTIALAGASTANTIVASGNFFAQLACDDNGNCLSDSNLGMPATRIEYTLATDVDFYDVSYINGLNVPAVMTPVPTTSLAYASTDPYRCMAAGGDAATLAAIAAFQSQHALTGTTALQAFACTNAYAASAVGALQGLNFVSTSTSATACTSTSDCAGATTCGLTLGAVTAGTGQLTCGQRLGYWSYAQLCAANASFASTALGVACNDATTRAYAQCTDVAGVTDQGPGRSCFNANTTTRGDTCCGFAAWSFGGAAQPMAVGQAAVAGVDTRAWTTGVLPVVAPIKAGCPLAYAFQFDDPYATFTCGTTTTPNATSYAITLCPGGATAGVDPPAAPVCTPTVPSGNDADQFVIGAPSGVTIAVAACGDAGPSCTSPVTPDGGSGSVYTTTGATTYQITATAGAQQQVCTFAIPASGCISRAGASSPDCATWSIATTGAWIGRSIGVPALTATRAASRARRR